jgi:hypothetical protein
MLYTTQPMWLIAIIHLCVFTIPRACYQRDHSRGDNNSYRRHASQANACTTNSTRQEQQASRDSLSGVSSDNAKHMSKDELQQQR